MYVWRTLTGNKTEQDTRREEASEFNHESEPAGETQQKPRIFPYRNPLLPISCLSLSLLLVPPA